MQRILICVVATMLGLLISQATASGDRPTWIRLGDAGEPRRDFATDDALWEIEPSRGLCRRTFESILSGDDDPQACHPLPGNRIVGTFTVSDDDVVYAIAQDPGGPGWTIMRFDPADRPPEWEVLPLRAVGGPHSIDVDANGTVWLGGHRREVFRRDGSQWVAEALPRPYHVDWIRMEAGGRGWAAASTRGHFGIFRRDGKSWRHVANFRNQSVTVLLADPHRVLLRTDHGFLRVSAEGEIRTLRIFEELLQTPILGFESEQVAWSVRDNVLRRHEGKTVEIVDSAVPFQVGNPSSYGTETAGKPRVTGVGARE